ncbi:mitochondrial 37S ribosomal protein [Saccharomycopsis crataegensis]|uniref:Mitochondrial 37S ribosomal protein n=1 Tax=Saccharomycopsis crataegensis TaxID=43959 RepID=A0AAV5QI23_9ASCO|nr:mitochondrial 37S ribosomal protein [Saccharomycopsis crataegensis]
MINNFTTGPSALRSAKNNQVVLNFVRHASRGKKIAYPFWKFDTLKNEPSKSHRTNLRYQMSKFLGPKNYKGEYYLNKYYYPPQDHSPNYIKPIMERGDAMIKDEPSSSSPYRRLPNEAQKLQPFPNNKYCKTNTFVSEDMRQKMFSQIEAGKTIQQIAYEFSISVGRIEALIRLNDIEKVWNQQKKISPSLKAMNTSLYNMLPLYNQRKPENLTEIPVPAKTLRSRFLTIAESEPFGPVDAAKVMGLEPAAVTLEKLSRGHDEGKADQEKKKVGFFAPVLQHEKSVFRFKDAKVGEVGIRYGKSNRDNKKDRKVGYNEIGQRIYI